jgi:hypothetical protein
MSDSRFYKPYVSDSEYESDTDSDVDSDGYTTEESLLNVPGRDKPVETGGSAPVSQTAMPPVDPAVGTKFETGESRNTFLFTINSRDRDTRVYPQPTFFTIRLPRVLKNVKQINITQLSLLNSFFNFSTEKGNTFMYVYETGRTVVEKGSNVPNNVKISIRNGTYTAGDLVTELNAALNATPLFSGISFADFTAAFRNTGNFTLLFNTPGPKVYNSLTQSYDERQTINNIVARYFQTVQTVGTVSYSDTQVLVAYYYPVIKEMIIAQPEPVPFSVAGQSVPPGFANWYDYLVFAFQGLDDPYVTQMVLVPENIPIFDAFRYQNTFNTFLVNKYTCSYNDKQGRLVITAPSLNDSIVTDLNTAYSNILATLVIQNGFNSLNDFNTQYASIQNSNASFIEYYNFLQKQFAVYFAVNFGKYSDVFYANSNNEIPIYNAVDRYGWNIDTNTRQLNISSNPPVSQISTLWQNILIPLTSTNISSFVVNKMPTYMPGTCNVYFSNAGEATYGYTDISFSIVPTTYTRFAFTSPCRQSISLMTLPRYINERSPGTDLIYNLNSTNEFLYSIATPSGSNYPSTSYYVRCDISGNLLFNMYTIQQNMFNTAAYMRGFDEWLNYITPQFIAGSRVQFGDPAFGTKPTATSVNLTSFRPYLFFQVDADEYPADPAAHFNISFYVETQDGSLFTVPIVIAWYKDRAGFMADAQLDVQGDVGDENPRHYFKRQVFTDVSSAMLTVDVDNLQTTYFMVNFPSTQNLPSSIPIRVFCILTDVYGVYRYGNIWDTYGMPWDGLPPLADQFTPTSAIYANPTKSIYLNPITQIGYDVSTVSNNLLDYYIQSGSNYYDPLGVQDFINPQSNGVRYAFVQQTPGSAGPSPDIPSTNTWSLYFAPGSSNVIRDLYNNTSNVYLSGGQTPAPLAPGFSNEFILVNWLQPASLVKEYFFWPAPTPSSVVTSITDPNSAFLVCSNSPALQSDIQRGESYSSPYIDSNGFAGVGFYLPPNSIVKLDRIQLKFAYTQPVTDSLSNLYTRAKSFLAVGESGDIYRTQLTRIQTSNSVFNDWDDSYFYNRRNVKLGIYRAGDINSAVVSTLSLSSALTTMTLNRVAQINNYQKQIGATRTREPDWGTYYTYEWDPTPQTVWTVINPNYESLPQSILPTAWNTNFYDVVTSTSLVAVATSSNNVDWFAYATTQTGVSNVFTISATPIQNNLQSMFGFATTQVPAFPVYNQIPYALYTRADGQLESFINGFSDSLLGPYSAGDQLSISYSLSSITMSQNGTPIKVYPYTPTSDVFYGCCTAGISSATYSSVTISQIIPSSTLWKSVSLSGDISPTYIAGENSTPNYFFTVADIKSYNYLPRSYGVGASVGNSILCPLSTVSSYTQDISAGFVAVPFYYDDASSTFKVGSFWGLSYTRTPMVPSTSLIGAAPYVGPPGPFGWYLSSATSTFELYNADKTNYEPYYWNAKIHYEELDEEYNPATDLKDFGYFPGISNEIQDTYMFFYCNPVQNNDYGDVIQYGMNGNDELYLKWGQESRNIYSDWDDQSGYNFLSYINNVQVRNSGVFDYAVHVRAYDPIPQFNTGLRIIGKNYTDFGRPSLIEVAYEIASLSSYVYITPAQGNYFSYNPCLSTVRSVLSTNNAALSSACISHGYADTLKQFDVAFSTIKTFGRRPGYAGVTYNLTGYSNALVNYIGFSSTIRGSLSIYTSILSSATGLLNDYVLDRYGSILPSTIISRNRITDPLPFSFLFYSKTPMPYFALPDEWGLGWNLGFNKVDTVPRTTITSDTFIRITQDYIYLRLNPEYNINTLAVSGKEDLSQTRDSAAQDTRYFSKILLAGFGGFSRAAVQLPKLFNPVVGKYETVSCQLVDKFGNQINNNDCDYDFVLEATEIDQRPKDTASLVLPNTVNQVQLVSPQGGATKGK